MIETDLARRDLAALIGHRDGWVATRREDRLIEWVGFAEDDEVGVMARWSSERGRALHLELVFRGGGYLARPRFFLAVDEEWITVAGFDHPSVERELSFAVRALRDIARVRLEERRVKERRAKEHERRALDEI